MSYPATYYVDRTTDTPADTLLAFGLADLIAHLIPDGEDWELAIEATNEGYKIKLREELPEKWIEDAKFFFQLDVLGVKRKDKKSKEKKMIELPSGIQWVDYDEQKAIRTNYNEARKKLRESSDQVALEIQSPHPNLKWWGLVSSMYAVTAYNKLLALWYAHRYCFPELLHLSLGIFIEHPNRVAAAEVEWKKLASREKISGKSQESALQITSPSMGKGGNSSKAVWGGAFEGLEGFWVIEYLKYVGLFRNSIPQTVGVNDERKGLRKKKASQKQPDRKTYVLKPKNLSWDVHNKIMPEFVKAMRSRTPVKMDILANLNYCMVFAEQWRNGQIDGRFVKMLGGRASDHIAAIETVSYKYMGSAFAPTNISTFSLPQWLPKVETREQSTQYLNLLSEHSNVIRGLQEATKGEEAELLYEYRNFLSSGNLSHFFHFTLGYSTVLMNRLRTGIYAPQFTLSNLEVLLMAHNKSLKGILENPGFRRIASAIRQSTVIPQRDKANRNKEGNKRQANPYEIRYGLGSDLMRQAAYPDKFAQALSRFLFTYLQENSQIYERFDGKPIFKRPTITEDDIAEVIALMHDEAYDSETVASLLVACGYASDWKPKANDAPSETESEITSDLQDEDLDDEGDEE